MVRIWEWDQPSPPDPNSDAAEVSFDLSTSPSNEDATGRATRQVEFGRWCCRNVAIRGFVSKRKHEDHHISFEH